MAANAAAADTESPERVMRALYDVISGPAERTHPRDWARFAALCTPDARFRMVRSAGEGEEEVTGDWDVASFRAEAQQAWAESGFWERETWSRTDRFGNVAQVFSTFESRVVTEDSAPAARGINSFQLVRQQGRWRVFSTIWDIERSDQPIPAQYLP